MALAAELKMNLAIAPIIPGRALAALEPTALSPFAKDVPSFFKALVIVPITAPIVTPAARRTEASVTPYFFEDLADPFS